MDKDKNQEPVIDNEDIATETNDSEYTFVKERIVTKRSRMGKVLAKLFFDLLVPVCVCLLVCYIYFFVVDKEDDEGGQSLHMSTTENGIIVDESNNDKEEQTTEEIETSDNLETEEKFIELKENIQKMIVTVAVVRGDDGNTEETTKEADEGTRKDPTGETSEGATEKTGGETAEVTTEPVTESNTEATTEDIMKDVDGTTDEATEQGTSQIVENTENTAYYTGVVVSINGPIYILIPQENISGYKELYAIIDTEITLPTTVYDIDETTGMALLKIENAKINSHIREKISVATFEGVNQVNEGSTIVYCGNMIGNTPMFIKGSISNSKNYVTSIDLNYNMLITDIMLKDAYDGFLFNSKGNLVGIVGLSTGGLEVTNVVAGARALDLKYIINNMLNDKRDIYFGITGQEVSAEIEAIAGGNMPKGIYVSTVLIDSPAYNAGIMPGDIIFTIDSLYEPDMNKFRNYIELKEKGDTIQVRVKRKIGNTYNEYSMTLTLESRD